MEGGTEGDRRDSSIMAPNTKSKLPIKCVYLGIDLGTTTSRVALWSIVAEAVQGMFEIPSYVAFTDTGLLIGDAAKNQLHKNASNTVFDVKWLIGRKFSDASVQHYKRLCPFQITEGLDDKLLILVSHCGLHKQLTLEEILAMLLVEVRQMAEDPTGSVVTHAIVTVPAYFNESQRQATKDAGTISGFEVIRIMNDPTAAAIKYAFDSQPTAKKKVFVLDFGGGFLDVSLIEISSTGIKVQATAGDLLLGGRDFDYVLVDHCVKILETERGMHVSGDPKALSMLWTACERAKINLSISDHTVIDVKALPGNTDVELDITRAVFQELNEDFSRKCSVLVQNCLEDADVVMSSVDDVMLLGGSVRMSWVEQYLRNYFERKNFWSFSQPEQVVACGAALKIGFMKRELKVSEVIPRSTCFQNSNTYNLIIVQKQTPPFL